jgi:hypothetical protein
MPIDGVPGDEAAAAAGVDAPQREAAPAEAGAASQVDR